MIKKLQQGMNKPRVITQEESDKIKAEVIRRDKERCVLCGKPYNAVHEVIFRSDSIKNSEEIMKASNRVCICNNCHHKIHTNPDFTRAAKRKALSYIASISG